MIQYNDNCYLQLTSLMKYYLPTSSIVKDHTLFGTFPLIPPVYSSVTIWMIIVVIIRIPIIVLTPWLIKKLNEKIKLMTTSDQNADYEETYCIFSYDLLRYTKRLLILNGIITFVDICYISLFVI